MNFHMCGFIHVYVIHHDVYILSLSYPCLPTYVVKTREQYEGVGETIMQVCITDRIVNVSKV